MGPLLCAGVIVALVSVTSCGGDDARTRATGDTAPTSGDPTGSEPPGSGGDPAAIIVSLDDLPSSWRVEPEPEGEDGGSGSCLDSVTETADVFGPTSTADSLAASFAQSDVGPFLFAMVATPVDDVDSSFDALAERLAACDGTTDAAGFTTLIEPLTFPTIGDEAFAVKADAANPNGSKVSYILALSRVDDTVVLAAHVITLGELDVALVEEMVRTMVGRA